MDDSQAHAQSLLTDVSVFPVDKYANFRIFFVLLSFRQMESEFRILCPICGRADIGSLPAHLQIHSKQALIDILVNKQENFIYQPLKPASNDFISLDNVRNEDGEGVTGHGHGHGPCGRRSASPPKRSGHRGASHSRRRSVPGGTGSGGRADRANSEKASSSRSRAHHHDSPPTTENLATLVYEVEIQNPDPLGHIDPETTEIMPVCSFSLPPTTGLPRSRSEGHGQTDGTQIHVLFPVKEVDEEVPEVGAEMPKADITHSNFIKYIVDEVRMRRD